MSLILLNEAVVICKRKQCTYELNRQIFCSLALSFENLVVVSKQCTELAWLKLSRHRIRALSSSLSLHSLRAPAVCVAVRTCLQ